MNNEKYKKYLETLELYNEDDPSKLPSLEETREAHSRLKRIFESDSMAIDPLEDEFSTADRQNIMNQLNEAYQALVQCIPGTEPEKEIPIREFQSEVDRYELDIMDIGLEEERPQEYFLSKVLAQPEEMKTEEEKIPEEEKNAETETIEIDVEEELQPTEHLREITHPVEEKQEERYIEIHLEEEKTEEAEFTEVPAPPAEEIIENPGETGDLTRPTETLSTVEEQEKKEFTEIHLEDEIPGPHEGETLSEEEIPLTEEISPTGKPGSPQEKSKMEDTLAEWIPGAKQDESEEILILKETRENLGLSIQDAAVSTGVKEETLRDIEMENFPSLPEAGELRWCIGTYAKALSLDSHQITDEYMKKYRKWQRDRE